MSLSGQKIGFIGGGQMAEALIRGVLSAKLYSSESLGVIDPSPGRRDLLHQQYGIQCFQNPSELCKQSTILIVAVKPQMAMQVLSQYQVHLTEKHLVISIMAGVSLQFLADIFQKPVRLIRVMPNTPALVLAAATAFCVNSQVTEDDRALALSIFSAVGTCTEVPEHLIDAVTGLSGSGPGYVFSFIEALIDGGVLAGLPRPAAEQLVLQTVYGSAKLAMETKEHPAVLKGQVTSPGGTTITGLHALEEGAFRGTVMNAVLAATKRSQELGG